MSAPENQVRPSTPQAHSNSVEQKSPVSYEVTVMCDRYNEILFNLFCVYAQSVNGELYHTIDDQLNLMQDYGVIPRYMTKDDVITCFNHIAEKRNDNSKIKTANCLNYEAFVECICRVALAVYANPVLSKASDSVGNKIASFIETWNLGDEGKLALHREERKR
ncbi:hypothetical protein WA588_001740, partial [Blastocystis sp. NMH]